MMPFVSIIVTCFNQAGYLERSVKSVLSQTYSNLECIIIDDGSTDNTQEIAQLLMSLDLRVSYFYKENGGVSSSRNFGFKQAQGEWIQFLDGDDWIHADKIRFQLSYLNSLEGDDNAFYTDYERVFIDKEGQVSHQIENTVGALTTEQLIQRLVVPDFLTDSPFPLLQQCLLMHRNVFVHKMFDERLKALQDRDFTLDLLLANVKFTYTPMVGAYYTKHQSNRTNNWDYMKNYYILFFETVCGKHPQLLPFSQLGIHFLIKEAIRGKEKDNFYRLIKLVNTPFYFDNEKIQINHKFILKIIYNLRLIIPSFILFDKYRGPRGRKVMSLFSNFINLFKNKNHHYINSQ